MFAVALALGSSASNGFVCIWSLARIPNRFARLLASTQSIKSNFAASDMLGDMRLWSGDILASMQRDSL